MQRRRLRSTIVNGDLNQQIFGIALGILDKHIEVSIFVKDAGVEQFVLHFFT